jgi:hypothetical protein
MTWCPTTSPQVIAKPSGRSSSRRKYKSEGGSDTELHDHPIVAEACEAAQTIGEIDERAVGGLTLPSNSEKVDT